MVEQVSSQAIMFKRKKRKHSYSLFSLATSHCKILTCLKRPAAAATPPPPPPATPPRQNTNQSYGGYPPAPPQEKGFNGGGSPYSAPGGGYSQPPPAYPAPQAASYATPPPQAQSYAAPPPQPTPYAAPPVQPAPSAAAPPAGHQEEGGSKFSGMLGKVGSNVANAATWGFGATRKYYSLHPFFGLNMIHSSILLFSF